MGRSGEPSRRSVLDAVGRIIRQRGLEGIRVREIAAEADLSPGAVLYHYPKNSDMLFAVHEDTVRQYVGGRVSAAGSSEHPRERLVAVVRAGIPPWANENVIRVLYEMHGLARRSAAHSALLSDLWTQEHLLYVDIIQAGTASGDFAPASSAAECATRLLALEDGLVLHLIGHNRVFDSPRVLESFLGFAGLQLGCPALTEIDAARA